MNKNNENDRIFESNFRQAVIDKHTEEVESIYADKEPYTFSPQFEARMGRLLQRERFKDKAVPFFRFIKKAAACFMLVVTVLSGLLILNVEVRSAVTGVITAWFEQYVSIVFAPNERNIADLTLKIGYIPYGYFELDRHDLGNTTSIIFVNEIGDILLIEYGHDFAIHMDYENRIIEERVINGNTVALATAIIEGDNNSVAGQIDEITVSIGGVADISELIAVFESLTVYPLNGR